MRVKEYATRWEKVSANHMPNKRRASKTRANALNSAVGKQRIQLENDQEIEQTVHHIIGHEGNAD